MIKRCATVGQLLPVATLLLALHLPACGDTSTNAEGTSNASSAGSGGTSGAGGGAGMGGSGEDSVGTTGTVGTGGSGANVATSTDGSTTSNVATSTSAAAGGSSGAGGGGPAVQCEVDADCNLFSDCCNCAAYPASGDGPEACPADCALDRCTAHGIESASCFAGQCIVATAHNCSPLAATCDSLPPQCSDGSLPSVGDNQCWTGSCVPAELCGWRPDCSSCGDDEVCFRGFNDVFGTPYYCAPRPSSCSDEANCACARQFCEALGFSQCADADDGIMQCSP